MGERYQQVGRDAIAPRGVDEWPGKRQREEQGGRQEERQGCASQQALPALGHWDARRDAPFQFGEAMVDQVVTHVPGRGRFRVGDAEQDSGFGDVLFAAGTGPGQAFDLVSIAVAAGEVHERVDARRICA